MIQNLLGEELKNISAGTCFADWSRCSAWSSGVNGHLWKTCSKLCWCMNWSNWECRQVPNTCWWLPRGSTISQCHCFGHRTNHDVPWLECRATW